MLGRLRRSFVFDTFDVFAKAVLPEHGKFNNPAGYRFSFASGDEIARCVESHTELNDRERREGAARVAMGHACVIAYPTEPGNAPAVFTMWVNPRNINIPGHIKRKLKPHQAFIYKAFTSPEHRGRKIYESGMRFVLAELARQGKSQLLGYAHIKKAVSRKGLAALQFDTIGTFRTFGIGRWCVTATSSRLRRELPEVLKSSGLPADHLYADAQTRVSRN
ncbi:MAG: hypothetical protein HY286_19735 [Planctomycetes bacterium]|nr:hypothetical protein [Planctomycetota bacterium]